MEYCPLPLNLLNIPVFLQFRLPNNLLVLISPPMWWEALQVKSLTYERSTKTHGIQAYWSRVYDINHWATVPHTSYIVVIPGGVSIIWQSRSPQHTSDRNYLIVAKKKNTNKNCCVRTQGSLPEHQNVCISTLKNLLHFKKSLTWKAHCRQYGALAWNKVVLK